MGFNFFKSKSLEQKDKEMKAQAKAIRQQADTAKSISRSRETIKRAKQDLFNESPLGRLSSAASNFASSARKKTRKMSQGVSMFGAAKQDLFFGTTENHPRRRRKYKKRIKRLRREYNDNDDDDLQWF